MREKGQIEGEAGSGPASGGGPGSVLVLRWAQPFEGAAQNSS